MDGEPPEKKPCIFNREKCIICFKNLATIQKGGDTVIKNPTSAGLQRIIDVSRARNDDVFKLLSPIQDKIISKELHASFHKSCRAKYTSSSNTYMFKNEATSPARLLPTTDEPAQRRSSRENTSNFDIRRDCFICGKINKRDEKLTSISTGTGQATRQKVLVAAGERLDDVVQMRMLTYTDLFAFDAKYHRKCYSHYISDLNIAAARKKADAEATEMTSTSYDDAMHVIVKELDDKVLSKDMTVTSLSKLRSKFAKTLLELGVIGAASYSSWKLKRRLESHYGNQLVFVDRPGLSSLICSSVMTVGDALRKASMMDETDDNVELEDLGSATNQMDEMQILHMAATILRNQMSSISDSDSYISSFDINTQECCKYVPDMLYDFVSWCICKEAHEHVSSCSSEGSTKNNLKIASICQNIISHSQHVRTPISLGLGIYAHHTFGSKSLIENLHALGHSVSYDEVRRFLTSVAVDQNTNDVFVPRGIHCDTSDNALIDAAIDNFDQNEDTLDGKSTTHAMAAVIYKRSPVNPSDCHIPRLSQKSLSALNAFNIQDEIVRYMKPAKRPEPPGIQSSSATDVHTTSDSYEEAEKFDLLWKLGRFSKDNDADQKLPAWTGFNSILSVKDLPIATIRYMPFLRAPPSEMSTIYTILIRLVEVSETIGQPHILVTADMAIYSKAQEILWSKPPQLDGKVTMRVGGMHTTMALLASLGKLYSDAGLLSLLTESGIYADATARQMLQGIQVSRGIRGIKIVYEALFRVFYDAMLTWQNKSNQTTRNDNTLLKFNDLRHAFTIKDCTLANDIAKELVDDHLPEVTGSIKEFIAVGRQQSNTFAYWADFMEGVEVLLHLLRAERDGSLDLHLTAMCEAIVWFRAAGRHNYAKYVPTYIADIKRLQQDHPQSYQHLHSGGFVVRRSDQYRFNAVSTDQALEQTVNKEGKSEGGIIGLTLRKGALTRWLITRHVTAEFSNAFKAMCRDTSAATRSHAELAKMRVLKDETDVMKVVELITQNQNPFDLDTVPPELVNIITGQVASPEVAKSLRGFLEMGKEKHRDFMENKLVETSKSKSFWDTESRTKVHTFADMRKTLPEDKAATKLMVDSEVLFLFRRLLIVSKQREVDLEKVLQHELAAIPPSLFHDDGTMSKCAKADLAKQLEAIVTEQQHLPQIDRESAYIFDGMALLQGLHEAQFNTFDDIGRLILQRIRILFEGQMGIDEVVIVFDRYDVTQSIKHLERLRRGSNSSQASHVITGNRIVPNYRTFMKSSGNKTSLATFVCEYLMATGPEILDEHHCIVLAGGLREGKQVVKIRTDGVTNWEEMYSSHEEADTRMLLHAINLAQTHQRLIIRCDDTDVLVLLIYYCSLDMLTNDLYMHAGRTGQNTNRERYIPVHSICEQLGPVVCDALPAAHALTGCDSTSSLFKIGKKTDFAKLVKHAEELPALASFGIIQNLEENVSAARKYALALYGNKRRSNGQPCVTLDELRYEYASNTDKLASSFPPTEDAFKQHVLRSMYQVAIWTNSHVSKPVLSNPVGNGWTVDKDNSNTLMPIFYRKDAAPVEVRDLTHLYCVDKNGCKDARTCHCVASGFTCTDLCGCQGQECSNERKTPILDHSDDSDLEDDSDDE